jgi:serine/threonine-protein kinase
MFTGKRPFDRGTPIATAMSHVNEPPPPLGDEVPADLRAVIEALLEKDPAARPENARAVAVMLGVPTGEDLSGLDIDPAAGVSGGYLVLPMTPLTPVTPLSTVRPAEEQPDDAPAATNGVANGAIDVPTMAASAEELLD